MRTNLILVTTFAVTFLSSLLVGENLRPHHAPKLIFPRATTVDCGQAQTNTLSALLIVVAQWARLALTALTARNLSQADAILASEIFDLPVNELRSPARRQVRGRFQNLQWESERAPGGRRSQGQGNVMLFCDSCASEENRQGYNLFAINQPRRDRYITRPDRPDRIKIVRYTFSLTQLQW